MPETRFLIAIDTAGKTAVVAVAEPDGTLRGERRWEAGFRHGEELLARLDALLQDRQLALRDAAAVVVGTGPGAFTGLRVGLATAKALAAALGIPIAGVPTWEALLLAARRRAGLPASAEMALLVPAGPSDRVVVASGQARLVRSDEALAIPPGAVLVAVDLEGRAPDDATVLGRSAVDGLAAALVELGAARLRAGAADDLARLVPEYVTLPRGVAATTGEVTWSRGRA